MDSDQEIEARSDTRPDSGSRWLSIGLVAFLFAVTGPIVVLLEFARHLRLSPGELQTIVIVISIIGGAITIWVSLAKRQPTAIVWNLPAVAFLLSAEPIRLSDFVGATLVTGIALVFIGWRKLDRRLMRHVSDGVMFGMIGGVLAPFVLAIATSFLDRPRLVAWMVGSYVVVAFARRWVPLPPPLLVTLTTGIIVTRPSMEPLVAGQLVALPELTYPTFTLTVMAGVVIPFIITVVAVQNAQGLSLLELAGHRPDSSRISLLCGASSIIQALGGCPPSSLAGPMQGILTSSSKRERQYRSALVFGVLYIAFGVFSPRIIGFLTTFPSDVVAVVAGLALLPVTVGSLTRATRSGDLPGAVIAFGLTISQQAFFGLPSAFWGLAIGMVPQLLKKLLDRWQARS